MVDLSIVFGYLYQRDPVTAQPLRPTGEAMETVEEEPEATAPGPRFQGQKMVVSRAKKWWLNGVEMWI